MNLSLTYLRLNGLFIAPTLSINTKTRFNSIIIKDSSISKSFFPFIKSNFHNKLEIQRSSFNRFLSSAIKIENLFVEDKTFANGLNYIYDSSIVCKDCQFRHCFSKNKGSAICTSAPLKLFCCLFQTCSSEVGAALYCADLDSNFCSFYDCIAKNSSSVAFVIKSDHLILIFTGCHKCEAASTALIECSTNDVSSTSLNLTQIQTSTSKGAFYFKNSNGNINYIIINSFVTHASCCGFYLENTKDFLFSHTYVARMVSFGSNVYHGTLIHGEYLQGDAKLLHSTIVSLRINRGYAFAAYNSNGGRIIVTDVCHNLVGRISEGDVVLENNTIKTNYPCERFIVLAFYRDIGYKEAIKKRKSWIQRFKNEILYNDVNPIVVVIFIVGIFLPLFYLLFVVFFPEKKKKSSKNPKKAAKDVVKQSNV